MIILSKKNNFCLSLNNYFSYFLPASLSIYYNYSIKYSSLYTVLLSWILIKNKNTKLPDKFIILLNHDFKESDIFTMYYLIDKILSGYSIKAIIGKGFSKFFKILELFGIRIDYIYYLNDNSVTYL